MELDIINIKSSEEFNKNLLDVEQEINSIDNQCRRNVRSIDGDIDDLDRTINKYAYTPVKNCDALEINELRAEYEGLAQSYIEVCNTADRVVCNYRVCGLSDCIDQYASVFQELNAVSEDIYIEYAKLADIIEQYNDQIAKIQESTLLNILVEKIPQNKKK